VVTESPRGDEKLPTPFTPKEILMKYLIAAFQIVLLLSSAIWTRNYIGDVTALGNLPSLAYAISGCISSILFFVAIVWILSSAPAREARANRRRS